jgi:hypothetical protein
MKWFIRLFDREARRIRQSYTHLLVAANDRDSFRYYEKGRWVTIEVELMLGPDFERLIYRCAPMKWNDVGADLTPDERENVFQQVTQYFNRLISNGSSATQVSRHGNRTSEQIQLSVTSASHNTLDRSGFRGVFGSHLHKWRGRRTRPPK